MLTTKLHAWNCKIVTLRKIDLINIKKKKKKLVYNINYNVGKIVEFI